MRTGGDIGHMLSGRATRRHFKGVHCMRWEDAQRSRVPAQLGTAHHLIARFACMNGMQLRCQTRVVSWVNCRLCTRESAGDHQHLAWHISWLDAVHRVRVPARESKRSARTEVGARDSLNLGCACGACTPDPTEEPRDKTGHVASCLHGCVALSTTLQEVGHCMVMHWRTRSTACTHIQRAPRSLKHLLLPTISRGHPGLARSGCKSVRFQKCDCWPRRNICGREESQKYNDVSLLTMALATVVPQPCSVQGRQVHDHFTRNGRHAKKRPTATHGN